MRVSRRDLLIVASVWLVGCVMLSLLVGFFYSQRVPSQPDQPPPVATYELAFNEHTAKAAYRQAEPEAGTWQDDVQLVAAAASWVDATVDSVGGARGWDLRFYSPGHERILFAAYTPDQPVATRAHLYSSRGNPQLINPSEWVVDSNEAITAWVNNGGGVFLETYPDNTVEVLLHQRADRDRPVWDIIGVNTDQSQVFYLTIDATSGQILK